MEDQNKNIPNTASTNVTNTPTSSPALMSTDSGQTTPPPDDLDDRWLRWKCLKCGFLYEGSKLLNVCPKCGNEDPDYFQDAA